VSRPVSSAFSFVASSLSTYIQSFVASRLDIGGSNLDSSSDFLLVSLSLLLRLLYPPLAPSFALAYLLPGTLSDNLGALSLGGSTYGASVTATCVVTSYCCLSSSFAFATSPFSSTCALSFCDCVAFFSFSLSLFLPFHLLC
jgi:hypothetical protein